MLNDDFDLESLLATAPPDALQQAMERSFMLQDRDDSLWIHLPDETNVIHTTCEPCQKSVRLFLAHAVTANAAGFAQTMAVRIGQCRGCNTIYWHWGPCE